MQVCGMKKKREKPVSQSRGRQFNWRQRWGVDAYGPWKVPRARSRRLNNQIVGYRELGNLEAFHRDRRARGTNYASDETKQQPVFFPEQSLCKILRSLVR